MFAAGALGLAATLTAAAALVAPAGARSTPSRQPAADEILARVDPFDDAGRSARPEALAVTRARHHLELARSAGDPRHLGRAQAALAAWWDDAAPPAAILLLRATIRQAQHDFAGARVDLDALLVRDPDDAQGRLTRAVVATVSGDHATALADCDRVGALIGDAWAAACAAPLATRGHGTRRAYDRLSALVTALPAGAAGAAWATTALGELARALGDDVAAEVHFRRALAIAPGDVYTLGQLADLLIDGGRAAEAVALLDPHAEPEPLRLRLAIAARLAGANGADAHAAIVRRGLEAEAARGDSTHQRERARYFLDVAPDAAEALAAARANWSLQRESIDARIFLEAAAAAGDRAAAAPVLAWIDEGAIDDAVLARARARLEGQP